MLGQFYNGNSVNSREIEKEIPVSVIETSQSAIMKEVYSNVEYDDMVYDKELVVSIGGMSFSFQSAFNNINMVMDNATKIVKLVSEKELHGDLNILKSHLITVARSFNRKSAIKGHLIRGQLLMSQLKIIRIFNGLLKDQ